MLFYNTADTDDLNQIEQLGGIRYQLLAHRHESSPALAWVKQRFHSQLGCSVLEAPFIHKDASADLLFDAHEDHLDDIEIIHTPGHTDGSLCFLYHSPHGRYLFTGDSLFLWDGRWATLVLESEGGNRDQIISSLQSLRNLNPDWVMSSGFVGEQSYGRVTPDEWRALIDARIAELQG